jgi:hypothetical protein
MRFPVAVVMLLTIGVFAADVEFKYEQRQFRSATIYARNSQQKGVLFKLTRTTSRAGNEVRVLREFSSPDGKVAARERITYDGDKFVSLQLEDLQIDGKGSAKVVRENGDATISFEYTKAGKHKSGSERFTADTVVNDMINPFLVTHWKQLMAGEAVKCRYMAISRAETVGFEFVKMGERTVNGMPMVIVKMAASNMIIAALVDPLMFNIEKNGLHRVLDYDGITTPKIQQGDKFKDLEAITAFDW